MRRGRNIAGRSVTPGRVGLVVAAALLAAAVAAADPAFDVHRVWRDLERIVGFGPRPSESAALERTRDYVTSELKKVGVAVRRQAFTVPTPAGPLRMANLIAALPGRRPEVILFGGHYDTKRFTTFRFVGANDGGSSTALLLELGRALSRRPREYTVWIVFLDGEEALEPDAATVPLWGSRHFVADLRRRGELGWLKAVVIADMIGDRDLDILREGGSTPWLTDALWRTARRLGHQRHFRDQVLHVTDDHVPFLEAGVPAALLIDFNYPPWHTAGDTLDKVSRQSLGVVGEVLLGALPDIEAALGRAGEARP
ncbi:MAG: M28 family peptidase [Candidatus Rokubacteria bacterium]|nr:M28 family peptidase [Candidatus Rokubacteria bacterium]